MARSGLRGVAEGIAPTFADRPTSNLYADNTLLSPSISISLRRARAGRRTFSTHSLFSYTVRWNFPFGQLSVNSPERDRARDRPTGRGRCKRTRCRRRCPSGRRRKFSFTAHLVHGYAGGGRRGRRCTQGPQVDVMILVTISTDFPLEIASLATDENIIMPK